MTEKAKTLEAPRTDPSQTSFHTLLGWNLSRDPMLQGALEASACLNTFYQLIAFLSRFLVSQC